MLLLTVITLSVLAHAVPTEEPGAHRQEKGFGIFPSLLKVITFNNDPCTLSSGGTGTCYSKADCSNKSGTASGKCAKGYGVCCHVAAEDYSDVEGTTTIDRKGGYFTIPGYSSSSRSNDLASSRQTVALANQQYYGYLTPHLDKVQMYLEFTSFDIIGPTEGACDKDYFELIGLGSSIQYPVLCGVNAGQHMYFDIDPTQTGMKLQMTVSSDAYSGRKWRVLVKYYTSATRVAMPRCLQYFTATSGSITSFNYGPTPQYLNNMAYTICFGYITNYCDIGVTFNSLSLGNSIGSCGNDYVQLGGSVLCGTETNYAITGNATGPINIIVSSDSANYNSVEGFDLSYTMMACQG